MRCFEHPETEAVATCEHCRRGLCTECAAEVGDYLACRGRCEASVSAHASMQRKIPASSVYLASGIVLVGSGVAAGVYAAMVRASEAFLGAGIVLVFWGLTYFRGVWPWRKDRR